MERTHAIARSIVEVMSDVQLITCARRSESEAEASPGGGSYPQGGRGRGGRGARPRGHITRHEEADARARPVLIV
jgi:hypothetical protein